MKIPVFGGASGTGLLKDLKLFVTFKQSQATDILKQVFPSLTTDASGNPVLEQDASAGTGSTATQYIQSVELDSPVLTVILGVIAATFALLLWLAIRKR